jgi:uncharacterized protein with GYD domain
LGRFTDQGIRGIREGPQRREAARQRIERLGGRMLSTYNGIDKLSGAIP